MSSSSSEKAGQSRTLCEDASFVGAFDHEGYTSQATSQTKNYETDIDSEYSDEEGTFASVAQLKARTGPVKRIRTPKSVRKRIRTQRRERFEERER
jgi:hypothetical protein